MLTKLAVNVSVLAKVGLINVSAHYWSKLNKLKITKNVKPIMEIGRTIIAEAY